MADNGAALTTFWVDSHSNTAPSDSSLCRQKSTIEATHARTDTRADAQLKSIEVRSIMTSALASTMVKRRRIRHRLLKRCLFIFKQWPIYLQFNYCIWPLKPPSIASKTGKNLVSILSCIRNTITIIRNINRFNECKFSLRCCTNVQSISNLTTEWYRKNRPTPVSILGHSKTTPFLQSLAYSLCISS